MVKKATLRRTRQRADKSRQVKIAATIAEIDRIKPGSVAAAKAIALFKSWLADESGYDEKVWPRIKKSLDRERNRVGSGRLFDA
jgi:hypothetical protein